MIEPTTSMVKVKMPSKCPIDLQDINIPVPYGLFIKLSLHVKILICEAHKVEPGNELCMVNFHRFDNVTTNDLTPDIDNLEVSRYQDEANIEDGDVGNLGVDDDQQILAHVTQCKVLPPSDI